MEEIHIDIACPEDAADLLAVYAPYVQETDVTFEYTVPCVEEFRRRVETTLQRFPYLKAVRGKEILGYAYVSPLGHRAAYDWSVETSIYVRMDARHAGIGKMLYTALEDVLHRQHIANLYACITYPNPASIAFHEKEGYCTVAHYHACGFKFGRWLDVVWMEKHLQTYDVPPLSVIPFPELLQTD